MNCGMCEDPALYDISVLHASNDFLREFVDGINESDYVRRDGTKLKIRIVTLPEEQGGADGHLLLEFMSEVAE